MSKYPYPYLGRKFLNEKPFVVWFLEEGKGVVVVNETDNEDIKFGLLADFDEEEFELLPPDLAVRLNN